jgi:aspartyl-tRNA(Asn)/glutamyl-tRNA(Gln) amidotransferase subunit B
MNGVVKRIRLTRIHMEEDAGKNIHDLRSDASLVDLNRAGIPLLEIVSEPDIRSAEEAGNYLRILRAMLQYLDICDGNMEEGSFRCDANVSVRPEGTTVLGTKVELKNLNSFKGVEKAIEFEILRQIEKRLRRRQPVQETRLWDPDREETFHAPRFAHDYALPGPDLLPVCDDENGSMRSGLFTRVAGCP